MSRIHFPLIALLALCGLSAAVAAPMPAVAAGVPPQSAGPADPYAAFMARVLAKYRLPGGSLAVMREGRLVHAQGYGFANVEAKEPATAQHLFRIASVSKPITAVAIMTLVESGKLRLDDKVFERLTDFAPLPAKADPRLMRITVQDLLRHRGGWDQKASGDPQFATGRIATGLGLTAPASARTVIRYMLGKPLDFDPGSKAAYSNFGYNVLGRLIEQVTGQTYEEYVQTAVLRPAGIQRMQIGHTFRAQRAHGEACYYAPPGAAPEPAVFPRLGPVPEAYGAWNLPALDAHGGWIASPVDLLRFAGRTFGAAAPAGLLRADTLKTMAERTTQARSEASPHHYAAGWIIEPKTQYGQAWSHAGALSGSTAAYLRYYSNGMGYAVTFNSLPKDYDGLFKELAGGMDALFAEVKQWPPGDRFAEYP